MEIIGKPLSEALDTYGADALGTTPAAPQRRQPLPRTDTDKVVLSPRAREIRDAAQQVAGMPAVRENKVHQIRQQISAGTYSVKGDVIAFKMIASSVFSESA